jgi:hypothetical protein
LSLTRYDNNLRVETDSALNYNDHEVAQRSRGELLYYMQKNDIKEIEKDSLSEIRDELIRRERAKGNDPELMLSY